MYEYIRQGEDLIPVNPIQKILEETKRIAKNHPRKLSEIESFHYVYHNIRQEVLSYDIAAIHESIYNFDEIIVRLCEEIEDLKVKAGMLYLFLGPYTRASEAFDIQIEAEDGHHKIVNEWIQGINMDINRMKKVYVQIEEEIQEAKLHDYIISFKMMISEAYCNFNCKKGMSIMDEIIEYATKNRKSKIHELKTIKAQLLFNGLEYEECKNYLEEYLKEGIPTKNKLQVYLMLKESNEKLGHFEASNNYTRKITDEGLETKYMQVHEDIYYMYPKELWKQLSREQQRKKIEDMEQRLKRLVKPL